METRAVERARVVPVVALALVVCCALCGYWFGSVVAVTPPELRQADGDPLISSMYAPYATSAVEEALVKGDGQVFAGQATDPAVRRPEMVAGGPEEQAYRYQRPLYGWLGWVASGGQRDNVAWALVVVTVLSTVALVAVLASWLDAAGRDPRLALLLLMTPGVFVDLTWVGPEVLGMALALGGLRRWMKRPPAPDRGWWVGTIALFALAGLCRETMLLVPAVLALLDLRRRDRRSGVMLALAGIPYLAWVLFLRVRIGAWPRGAVEGRLSLIPLRGLFQAMGEWGALDFAFTVGLVALGIVAAWRQRSNAVGVLVAVHLAVAATLGAPVWVNFSAYGRVLLPLTTLTLLGLLLPPRTATSAKPPAEADLVTA